MKKRDMELRERGWTEAFRACPKLAEYFIEAERLIAKSGEKQAEKLREKTEALAETARALDGLDLEIAYYLKKVRGVDREALLHVLRNAYKSECELQKALYGTDERDRSIWVGLYINSPAFSRGAID